jgi:hypothetical protein
MTEMSQERLEVCTKTISEALPQVTESLENIVSMVNSAAQDVNTSQQAAESRIRSDFDEVKGHMRAIEDLQRSVESSNQEYKEELSRWQMELQNSVQCLCHCTQTYLDILLEKARTEDFKLTTNGTNGSNFFQLLLSSMQIISSGMICGVAVASHNSYSSPLLTFQKNPNGPEYSPMPVSQKFTATYENAWAEAFNAAEETISRKESTHAEQAPAKDQAYHVYVYSSQHIKEISNSISVTQRRENALVNIRCAAPNHTCFSSAPSILNFITRMSTIL